MLELRLCWDLVVGWRVELAVGSLAARSEAADMGAVPVLERMFMRLRTTINVLLQKVSDIFDTHCS